MTGKPCKHCAGFCGDSGQTCEQHYDAVWGPRANQKPNSSHDDAVWQVVDRLLSDAFSAAMNGDEFDMLNARAKFTASLTEAKRQGPGEAVADVLWRIDNEAEQFIGEKGMIYLGYLRGLLAGDPPQVEAKRQTGGDA